MTFEKYDDTWFNSKAREFYGGTRGWQVRLAKELSVTPQTVSNWSTGRTPIPLYVYSLLLDRLKANQNK